jgi:hypothetical protein
MIERYDGTIELVTYPAFAIPERSSVRDMSSALP